LLAFLAARAGGDVAAAEDALSEAFAAALTQWPATGVPDKPEAWLLTAARRRLIDWQRRGATRLHAMAALHQALEAAQTVVDAGHDFPDERLKLLFVCAHRAIDPAARTPLMLQTVLGLEAERIASAFLTSPAAMSQRLVRAKTRIRDAGIPFTVPDRAEWPERLAFVLDAIYAAFTCGWDTLPDGSSAPQDLASEAIWLARVLVHLVPEEPEALGLLALLLHSESRRAARLIAGKFIPLPEQDPAQSDQDMTDEAEALLHRAARLKRPGRFQLEAAIQSVHTSRRITGSIHWPGILALYAALLRDTGALGAHIGRAIALAYVQNPGAGLAALDAIAGHPLEQHQQWHAARAHLLHRLGSIPAARAAYQKAIGLTSDPAVRAFLMGKVRQLL